MDAKISVWRMMKRTLMCNMAPSVELSAINDAQDDCMVDEIEEREEDEENVREGSGREGRGGDGDGGQGGEG
jgi:hypothetical protein